MDCAHVYTSGRTFVRVRQRKQMIKVMTFAKYLQQMLVYDAFYRGRIYVSMTNYACVYMCAQVRQREKKMCRTFDPFSTRTSNYTHN